MTSTYATVEDLTARLSSSYTVPDDADKLLLKASELIDYATMGRAELAWVAVPVTGLTQDQIDATNALVTAATCDQVEFWMEVGEEHDVASLRGALLAGRLQVSPVPGTLGRRTIRQLSRAGLLYGGGSAQ